MKVFSLSLDWKQAVIALFSSHKGGGCLDNSVSPAIRSGILTPGVCPSRGAHASVSPLNKGD
jgi:hypothetical protein